MEGQGVRARRSYDALQMSQGQLPNFYGATNESPSRPSANLGRTVRTLPFLNIFLLVVIFVRTSSVTR